MRFQASAAFLSSSLTYQCLGDTWLVASSSTVGWQLASAVKLKRVRIWGAVSSSLQPTTVVIEFPSTNSAIITGNSFRYMDTSIGATTPSFVEAKPPKNSGQAAWHKADDATTCMLISVPVNSIIDVEYELVLHDDGVASAVATPLTSAATGALYARGLDALSYATTKFPPLGVEYI